MSFSTAQLSPSILHSLVDNFFEGKKAQVKERLRMSMDNIVNDLFDEMVGQVKEMLLPSKEAPVAHVPAPQTVTKQATPNNQNFKPPLPKVKKVLKPNYDVPKKVPQPSTSKCTPKVVMVSVQTQPVGQKRTADSSFLDDTSSVGISNNAESSGFKKSKLVDQYEDVAIYDDLANYDFEDGDRFEGSDNNDAIDEQPTYQTLQPAAVDYSFTQQDNGDKIAPVKEKTIEVSGQFVCHEADCGKRFQSKYHLMRHARSHSGVKPYACGYPNCTFTSAVDYNTIRHIRQVHLKNMPVEEGQEPPDPSVYLIVNQEQL